MSLLRSSLAFVAAAPGVAYADIITDGTAGPATSLSGPNFTIADTLGTTAGTNLFHSFQEFDILPVKRRLSPGRGYDNVISRVTEETQQINGALNSTIPGADFYFINPAGVTFGSGASVNVPAGFHVSTADKLNFSNGDVLLSAGGAGSTFSSAPVADFGFPGARAGDISFDGGASGFAPSMKLFLRRANVVQR